MTVCSMVAYVGRFIAAIASPEVVARNGMNESSPGQEQRHTTSFATFLRHLPIERVEETHGDSFWGKEHAF